MLLLMVVQKNTKMLSLLQNLRGKIRTEKVWLPEMRDRGNALLELVDELKRELIGQVSMLDEGILLHKKKCTTEMMGLQVLLEQKLDEMKEKSKSFK